MEAANTISVCTSWGWLWVTALKPRQIIAFLVETSHVNSSFNIVASSDQRRRPQRRIVAKTIFQRALELLENVWFNYGWSFLEDLSRNRPYRLYRLFVKMYLELFNIFGIRKYLKEDVELSREICFSFESSVAEWKEKCMKNLQTQYSSV